LPHPGSGGRCGRSDDKRLQHARARDSASSTRISGRRSEERVTIKPSTRSGGLSVIRSVPRLRGTADVKGHNRPSRSPSPWTRWVATHISPVRNP
jgi:hypothetical protein